MDIGTSHQSTETDLGAEPRNETKSFLSLIIRSTDDGGNSRHCESQIKVFFVLQVLMASSFLHFAHAKGH